MKKLSKKQLKIVKKALDHDGNVFIFGEGGTGKSELVKEIFRRTGATVAVYTHAAKNRLGLEEARTVASVLNSQLGINFAADSVEELNLDPEYDPDGGRLLLLDECSMVNTAELRQLRRVFDKIIAFGDVMQLPPIKGREVKWHDGRKFKQLELTKNYRTGEEKELLKKIRKNRVSADVSHYPTGGIEDVEDLLEDGEDVRVLCHTRNDVDTINEELKHLTKKWITNENNIRHDDRVIFINGDEMVEGRDFRFIGNSLTPEQMEEYRELMNTPYPPTYQGRSLFGGPFIEVYGKEIPYIETVTSLREYDNLRRETLEDWKEFRAEHDLNPPASMKGRRNRSDYVTQKYRELKVRTGQTYQEWRRFLAITNNVLVLTPSVAMTIHKAQGSTYDHVFVKGVGRDLNLTYVAVSRARKSVTCLRTK